MGCSRPALPAKPNLGEDWSGVFVTATASYAKARRAKERRGYGCLRRLRTAAKSIEEISNPMRKIADILDEFGAEIDERDLPCSQHQHHAKQNQIHQINHHEREKRPVVPQIRLILGNHPAREGEMECPCCADRRIE